MIEVAAVVIRNPQGHVLTVRKKSSTKYQLPGGKPEAGEALVDAAPVSYTHLTLPTTERV